MRTDRLKKQIEDLKRDMMRLKPQTPARVTSHEIEIARAELHQWQQEQADRIQEPPTVGGSCMRSEGVKHAADRVFNRLAHQIKGAAK